MIESTTLFGSLYGCRCGRNLRPVSTWALTQFAQSSDLGDAGRKSVVGSFARLTRQAPANLGWFALTLWQRWSNPSPTHVNSPCVGADISSCEAVSGNASRSPPSFYSGSTN